MTENSNEQTYHVKPGETIQSIAIKLECTVSELKQANNLFSDLIFPGDVLIIPNKQNKNFEPIKVSLYDCESQKEFASGHLLILDEFLRFEPDDISLKPIVFKLIGHTENAMFPFPSEELNNDPNYLEKMEAKYLLAMTFLQDINVNESYSTLYFCGRLKDIRSFKERLDNLTKEIQEREKYSPPNINKIISEQKVLSTPNEEASTPNDNNTTSEQKNLNTPNEEASPPRKIKRTILRPITFIDGESEILTPEQIDNLRNVLPTRFKQLNWKLLFKLSEDGSSYTTFYNATYGHEPIVMILKNQYGDKIGAFIPQQLKKSREYYGTGETFVFRFTPSFEFFGWNKDSNQYFISSSSQEISIGGGGSSAIWIDGDLLNAFSEPCSTFNSPSLTSFKKYKVNDLEIWTIPHPKRVYRVPSSI